MTRLRDYQTFVAVVEAGSLSGAADHLHRSVSAVSKQLSRFENDLGVSLVQRSTHALAITEVGKEFYHHCNRILGDIAVAEAALVEGVQSLSGTLRLSLPEVLINAGVFELLTGFSQQYPGLRLDLKVSNRIESLEAQHLDAALRIADLADSCLIAVRLGQTSMRICASLKYLERFGTPHDLRELTEQHQLLLPDFVNLSEQIRRLFPAGERPRINIKNAHRMDSETALHAAMHSGLGIGFILDIAARPAIEQGALVPLLSDLALPSQPIHLVFRRTNALPEKIKALKEFLVDHFPHIC